MRDCGLPLLTMTDTTVPRGRTVYRARPALRTLRERGPAPKTLRELAGIVAVDPAHLSRVELGLKNMTPAKSLAIALALGANRDDLFDPVVTTRSTPNPTQGETHDQAERTD
jgi:hypothetical protein